ncbi:hypothetical protein J7E94_10140 [Streptomyces sp. ISL-94]|nr:hypothetical protein [Streptomyces sp. ISL-94]
MCCTAVAGLTGCGGPARDGYAAVGAAAPGPERGPGQNVAPQGQVEFQQLGGGPSAAGGSSESSSSTSTSAPGSQAPGSSAQGGATPPAPGGREGTPGTPPGAGPATTPPGSSGPSGTSGGATAPGTAPGTPGTPTAPGTKPGTTPPAPPSAPARLTLSTPARAAAADRWCERVTVTFTNTGTTAARAGTVTFATHIIGALGIDWATITTTQPLPAPIAGGAAKTQTYTVCVEAWRVPLGMRVETRQVTATWS